MDLETENRIASILLKEAAELRRQAEKEGALAYIRSPAVRSRPNSRFLTATVLGVQQANRAVEVNEMWRLRQKELELENRLRGKSRDEGSCDRNGTSPDIKLRTSPSRTSKKRVLEESHPADDECLRDDEIDKFLHSRVKRGRGAVGSRMDETGPYLPSSEDSKGKQLAERGEDPSKDHVAVGPEKPTWLKTREASDDELLQRGRKERIKSSKKHSRKHRTKEKSKDKKKRKRREEKRRKHKEQVILG